MRKLSQIWFEVHMDTTRELIDRLKISPALRRICGWEKISDIPHESSFSRAFKEF
jgi:hypothetical protein